MAADPAGAVPLSGDRARVSFRVEGIVQGVGFRPFVAGLAERHRLAGFVGNDPGGVFGEVEGAPPEIEGFVAALANEAPFPAVVERVLRMEREATGGDGFSIVDSQNGAGRAALISADVATCDSCLRELFDPADRRYRYPFVNCTHCGPRFTIVTDIPYDRVNTTMAGFAMCRACSAEYHDPADRRFHAQPVCCPECGPHLTLLGGGGDPVPGDPVAATAGLLRAGAVVAVKGLGGYHLAALAADEDAVAALRQRKHREDKPFAVMAADVPAAARLVELDAAGEALLTGPRRPVVLAPRRPSAGVAAAVAPGNRSLGVMLPYTPLHHLLTGAVGAPFVLTSGNLSDEPIAYRDGDARARLGAIADAFLVSDRPIHIRTDDSVLRSFRGRPLPVRRSRGYAPEPIRLARPLGRPVLGCGAELKSTFCLARGHHAFVSHHIGDLENAETLASYREGIEHFGRLFGVEPELVAHDLHPEYLSTKYALALGDVDLIGVQHHHAHIASCLADNGEAGPVIGVAFDGLGYGTDGTLWGGEFLVADLEGFTRAGHLAPVPMPGGPAAVREPWRMAVAWLDAAYGADPPAGLAVQARNEARWRQVRHLARGTTAAPLTSSVGRLFDAVAALAGIRDRVNYEGQAAVELEQAADLSERGAYPMPVDGEGVLAAGETVRAIVDDLDKGTSPAVVSTRFHRGLAAATVEACRRLAAGTGVGTVALSGGVFQNLLLLEATVAGLESAGLRVLTHSQVPPNDGGISLGQVVVGGRVCG